MAKDTYIAATIAVQFGEEDIVAKVSAEIDTREDGKNQQILGKTSGFKAGESVYALVYFPPTHQIVRDMIYHSLEGVAGASVVLTEPTSIKTVEEQDIQLPDDTQIELSKAALGKPTIKWLGLNLEDYLGAPLTFDSENPFSLKLPPIPKEWFYKEEPNDPPAVKKLKKKAAYKRTHKISSVRLSYSANAQFIKINTPKKQALQEFGEPPYSMRIVVVCERIED